MKECGIVMRILYNMSTPLYDGTSDEELVALMAEHPSYIAGIIERYEEKIRRYIRRISSCGEDDVDDMLQDIFIKVYRNSTAFDGRVAFSSWLYRIAHNTVVSSWRKRQARPHVVGGEEAELLWERIASDDNPAERIDNALAAKKIRAILNKLHRRYREVLVLKYLEEKSYEEISDILQIPPGTVATWLNRGKKEFKKLYKV